MVLAYSLACRAARLVCKLASWPAWIGGKVFDLPAVGRCMARSVHRLVACSLGRASLYVLFPIVLVACVACLLAMRRWWVDALADLIISRLIGSAARLLAGWVMGASQARHGR